MTAGNADVQWVMEWYASQCDGDWEHQFGVRLDTLDNPGWRLEIDLEGTSLEDRPFKAVERGLIDNSSWLVCRVGEKKFIADCGSRDLIAAFSAFREWAT